MTRTTPILTTLLLVLVLAMPHSAALHCNGEITTIPVGDETFYVDDRSNQAGDIDHWVYQEWNGQDGLQSGSPVYVMEPPLCALGVNICYDPCEHRVPDRLIL